MRLLLLFALTTTALAQSDPLLPPPNGPASVDVGWHALVGVTLHPAPGEVVRDATLVLRDGRIAAVLTPPESGGPAPAAPAGARAWDLEGHHIYAGLIEPYLEVEVKDPESDSVRRHWNEKVRPERSALDGEGIPKSAREELRKLGFTAAAASPRGGIFRGRSAVLSLAKDHASEDRGRLVVHAEDNYTTIGRARGRSYPSSEMGHYALIRQVLSDARWMALERPEERGHALRALNVPGSGHRSGRFLFDADDELRALRMLKIADEHALQNLIVLGSGREFRRLDAIAARATAERDPVSWILPLDFPEAPKLENPADFETVDLRTLMTWEQAPANPARLHRKGLDLSLTTHRLRKRSEFWKRVRTAIRHGLPEDAALAMLTTRPAALLGLGDRMGTIREGHVANLLVCDRPLFDEGRKIRSLWIDGRRHVIEAPSRTDEIDGRWLARVSPNLGSEELVLALKGGTKLSVEAGEKKAKTSEVSSDGNRLSFLLDPKGIGADAGPVATSLLLGRDEKGKLLRGSGVDPLGRAYVFEARPAPEKDESDRKPDEAPSLVEVPELPGLPFGPYATKGMPASASLLIRHATIWTCAERGIIEDGAILIHDGRILWVGEDAGYSEALAAAKLPGLVESLDAKGKHLTPGLIDCHSHTGISGGVNEGTQTCTAEVRIQDVTNPDSISWYRQLAGGVTCVNNLHGSANPIGGQSQTNKVRWGVSHPEQMHLKGAKPGIKFALGENVKRGYSTSPVTRYPSTRMGVEVIMRDRFLAARRYLEERRTKGGAVRKDLELEAIAEILEGKRLIHCHSYRQDEILMLCRLAEEFGFKIGTFQHVLEGYKVAEAIKDNAIGASAFSDWWAYKVEVQDAIPFGGAIMARVGVNVSFNSDSDELARRLNTEAAKAVKYGGLSREDALCFVTLNPAIQLGIDGMVGSLEVGKHADLALWSADPLSSFARCEATWVDGRPLFDLERDAAARRWHRSERARLIARVLEKGNKGSSSGRGRGDGFRPGEGHEHDHHHAHAHGHAHTDDIRAHALDTDELEELRKHYLHLIRMGRDPEAARCCQCGVHSHHH